MDSLYINRVKIYNATAECFKTMYRIYKNYGPRIALEKIMIQPKQISNIESWREKNWGCSSNALNQLIESEDTVFFESQDGFPLNVFKMLSVKHNTVQISLLSWNQAEVIGHNYLLQNGEIIKYNFITPEENEHLYQQMIFLFTKCYYDKI